MTRLVFSDNLKNYYSFDSGNNKIGILRKNIVKKMTVGIVADAALRIPPNTGVTYRLYFLSRKLVEKGIQIKIYLCNRNLSNRADIDNLLHDLPFEVHIIPEKVFYNPERLEKIIKNNPPHLLQFEDSVSLLRCSHLAEKLKIPTCLEMHDVDVSLKELMACNPKDVELARIISHFACLLAEKIICMAPFDYNELIHKVGVSPSKLCLVPNPVDCYEFPFYGPNFKRRNILFIGNMFYWPNRDAVGIIASRIYPAVARKFPDTKFTFVGMVPASIGKKFKDSNLVFTGSVDNLNNYLKEATIALCPIQAGSGMKVKILNYCAGGLPVITTTVGASGYEKISSLIIEDDLNKYAGIIIDLLKSPPARLNDIGRRNREDVKRNYDINIIATRMIDAYNDILNSNHFTKHSMNTKTRKMNLPLPFWLDEGRVKTINDNRYYFIKNGKILSQKTMA